MYQIPPEKEIKILIRHGRASLIYVSYVDKMGSHSDEKKSKIFIHQGEPYPKNSNQFCFQKFEAISQRFSRKTFNTFRRKLMIRNF